MSHTIHMHGCALVGIAHEGQQYEAEVRAIAGPEERSALDWTLVIQRCDSGGCDVLALGVVAKNPLRGFIPGPGEIVISENFHHHLFVRGHANESGVVPGEQYRQANLAVVLISKILHSTALAVLDLFLFFGSDNFVWWVA